MRAARWCAVREPCVFCRRAKCIPTKSNRRLRCLHVSSEAEVFQRLARQRVVPKKPSQINGLMATWLANRLYAEFSREDTASGIAIEGLVLAILAEIARADSKPNATLAPRMAPAGHRNRGVAIPGAAQPGRDRRRSRRALRASVAAVSQVQPLHHRRVDPPAPGAIRLAPAGAFADAAGGDRTDLRLLRSEPPVVPVQALHGDEPIQVPESRGAGCGSASRWTKCAAATGAPAWQRPRIPARGK